MCTVTFVRSGNKAIITSNRDEHIERPSLPPQQYLVNNRNIVFPKDSKSDGTWYAVEELGNVIVLLNGAAEKHKHLPPYRRSRGLIVLDLISKESPAAAWVAIDLENIEPFTLVLFQQSKLYQMRWNGFEKDTIELNANHNYIWSSTTLYPEGIRAQRNEWFFKYLHANPTVSAEGLLHFHRYTEAADDENGLVINRRNVLKTLSITQTVIAENDLTMTHQDLLQNSESKFSFEVYNDPTS